MTSVSAGHFIVILISTQPVGSGWPQRESLDEGNSSCYIAAKLLWDDVTGLGRRLRKENKTGNKILFFSLNRKYTPIGKLRMDTWPVTAVSHFKL